MSVPSRGPLPPTFGSSGSALTGLYTTIFGSCGAGPRPRAWNGERRKYTISATTVSDKKHNNALTSTHAHKRLVLYLLSPNPMGAALLCTNVVELPCIAQKTRPTCIRSLARSSFMHRTPCDTRSTAHTCVGLIVRLCHLRCPNCAAQQPPRAHSRKPVATTVIESTDPMSSSICAPKMMLASGWLIS